jgi:hypothetical protein
VDRHVTSGADLVIDALATARLTRLVTRDRLTKPWRRRAITAAYGTRGLPDTWDAFGPTVVTDDLEAPEIAYLLSCTWCSSLYVALVVLALRATVPGLWSPIAKALAASQLTGMTAD